jgi:tRNA (guanine-N7-)-methyltransferase
VNPLNSADTVNPPTDPKDHPQFYGRRQGHKLRQGRQRLIDELLPSLQLTLDQTAEPARLFEQAVNDTWLEIGFGAGEHLAGQALAYPNVGFIGCEPFINGVATLLRHVEQSDISNIKIFNDDARQLLPVLPEESIGRVFVLFSDPWPKTRHHRRRFITSQTLDQLARLMKDGAELRFVSDHAGYIRWVLELIQTHPDFTWPVRRPCDWQIPPADWVSSRYEMKAQRQGIPCIYLCIRRRPR